MEQTTPESPTRWTWRTLKSKQNSLPLRGKFLGAGYRFGQTVLPLVRIPLFDMLNIIGEDLRENRLPLFDSPALVSVKGTRWLLFYPTPNDDMRILVGEGPPLLSKKPRKKLEVVCLKQ